MFELFIVFIVAYAIVYAIQDCL